MRKVTALLLAALVLVGANTALADKTITLDKDTKLVPQGWTVADFYHPYRPGLVIPADGHVRYMGNKSVIFAKDGTVLSGVIDNDVILQLSDNGYGFVRFKNDNLLTFDADGRVITGTLAEATKLRPLGWQHNLQDESAGFVEFKSGTGRAGLTKIYNTVQASVAMTLRSARYFFIGGYA